MNQLTSQQAGGALVFKGTVSEPSTVTVGGKPATVTVDNRFEGQADVPEGTGQVDIVATDPSGNVRTSTYEVSQAGSPKSFTYDLNGNMTSDGTRTYEWDAENRLVAVKEGPTTVASVTYNHRGIRTSKTTAAGTTTYVLEGNSVVEERNGSGVTKHFQGPGIDNVLAMQDGAGVVTYLTRDHLGSIRERVDATGTTVTLRRDYGPWGNMSAGATSSGWAYTGREWDAQMDLYYYRARSYDPVLGRFRSPDPAGIEGGSNLYRYAQNDPIGHSDPGGLRPWKSMDAAARFALHTAFSRTQSEEREYCGVVYRIGGCFDFTPAESTGKYSCISPVLTFREKYGLPAEAEAWAAYHVHWDASSEGYDPEVLSTDDRRYSLGQSVWVYLMTPSLRMIRYGAGYGPPVEGDLFWNFTPEY
jgi:RHS repeat-associated protein